MESLLRTRVSEFVLEDSLTLSQIEQLRDDGSLGEHILAVDKVFSSYPQLVMKEELTNWSITAILLCVTRQKENTRSLMVLSGFMTAPWSLSESMNQMRKEVF